MGGLVSIHGPVAPVQALTWGYNRQTFVDNFASTSTIDLANSKAAGKKWYINNSWPAATVAGGGSNSVWSPAASTSSSDITISNSILTLANDNSGFGQTLNTACENSSNGYVGHVFGGGGYFEAEMAYNQANYMGSGAWPVFWGIAIEFLIGPCNTFIEIDIGEAYPPGSGLQAVTHQWNNTIDPAGDTFTAAQTITPDTSYHKYGFLWVPMSKNSGTGLLRYYVDNVLQSACNVSYTSGQTYSTLDAQHLCLILGCGHNFPSTWKSVSVWQ